MWPAVFQNGPTTASIEFDTFFSFASLADAILVCKIAPSTVDLTVDVETHSIVSSANNFHLPKLNPHRGFYFSLPNYLPNNPSLSGIAYENLLARLQYKAHPQNSMPCIPFGVFPVVLASASKVRHPPIL